MSQTKALVLLAGVAITGCAGKIRHDETVRVIGPAEAELCTSLGDVHAVSGLYGVFAAKGFELARNSVIRQAKELGANAVVLQALPGHGSNGVYGLAYRCR